MTTQMKTSKKRIFVRKRCPTTAPERRQCKNLDTRQILCAQVMLQKQLCSWIWCVVAPVSKSLFELHVEIP